MKAKFVTKDFIVVTLITSLWVHASQLARFFPYVKPKLAAFLPTVPNLAPMDNLGILFSWGLWDMLLAALYVGLFWLVAQVNGNTNKSVLISALMSWCFFFVLYWVGTANMNLAPWSMLLVILPLALPETVVASFMASRLYARRSSQA